VRVGRAHVQQRWLRPVTLDWFHFVVLGLDLFALRIIEIFIRTGLKGYEREVGSQTGRGVRLSR
jgi:hypothetical protein